MRIDVGPRFWQNTADGVKIEVSRFSIRSSTVNRDMPWCRTVLLSFGLTANTKVGIMPSRSLTSTASLTREMAISIQSTRKICEKLALLS